MARQPTMRLLSAAGGCLAVDAKFGIEPLQTSVAMFTPPEHSRFELIELSGNSRSESQYGMPWEGTREEFQAFRSKLPETVDADSIYERVVLPELKKPHDGPQRSREWHEARAFAVTASQFSQTSENAASLLKSKTYPKQHGFNGNAYTEWGAAHERHAEEAFQMFLHDNGYTGILEHPAHLRDPVRPFIGFSPDALLWDADRSEVALVEYKCPAARRSGPGHPYGRDKFSVPPRYMPQIQGSLHLLRELYPGVRCVRAWFVVWQPHQFFVTHVPYAPLFASRTIECAEAFYRSRFLPACAEAVIEREKRDLQSPESQSTLNVPSPFTMARAAATNSLARSTLSPVTSSLISFTASDAASASTAPAADVASCSAPTAAS